MKLSDRLFKETEELWIEASQKEFLKGMADGSLEIGLFKNYMIEDYHYLKDYIEILKQMLNLAEDEELRSFLERIIQDTEYETYSVHVPYLKELGITDGDVEHTEKGQVIIDYVDFMMKELNEYGILAGLTALLQCSWNYAYIAKAVSDRFSNVLSASQYKDWFKAYTASSYTESNQLWIDMVDERAKDISDEDEERLLYIFKTCAEYENKLWDYLLG